MGWLCYLIVVLNLAFIFFLMLPWSHLISVQVEQSLMWEASGLTRWNGHSRCQASKEKENMTGCIWRHSITKCSTALFFHGIAKLFWKPMQHLRSCVVWRCSFLPHTCCTAETPIECSQSDHYPPASWKLLIHMLQMQVCCRFVKRVRESAHLPKVLIVMSNAGFVCEHGHLFARYVLPS